jgi:hypothetical protein
MNCLGKIVTVLCLWVTIPAAATPVDVGDRSATLEPPAMSAQDRRFGTALLFDFSPLIANNRTTIQGFADPLGMGVDPALGVFDGKVKSIDLLGYFTIWQAADTADIELPPDALHGINPLDNLTSVYLPFEGRATDKSLFNLRAAEVIERNGLPITSETSPLSLSGYGSVSENLGPLNVHWTSCASQDKRKRSMAKAMKAGQHPCSVPGACVCFGE